MKLARGRGRSAVEQLMGILPVKPMQVGDGKVRVNALVQLNCAPF